MDFHFLVMEKKSWKINVEKEAPCSLFGPMVEFRCCLWCRFSRSRCWQSSEPCLPDFKQFVAESLRPCFSCPYQKIRCLSLLHRELPCLSLPHQKVSRSSLPHQKITVRRYLSEVFVCQRGARSLIFSLAQGFLMYVT